MQRDIPKKNNAMRLTKWWLCIRETNVIVSPWSWIYERQQSTCGKMVQDSSAIKQTYISTIPHK